MTQPAAFPLPVRPGLELVPTTPAMAAPYFAMVERNLPRLARWEPWANEPQTLSGVRVYLAWQAQGLTSGTLVPLVIMLNGEVVGSCSARIDPADQVAEIGYWIDEAHEGAGIAAASVGVLVDHLFTRGDIGRVQARTAATNTRSRALLERIGFDFEGVLRSSQRLAGRRVDMAMYARVAPDAD
ncbi:MAG: N-acetyltransferase [Microbacteriaceae bacterium]|jgi:ribosomal-protein-serine acetyltransferase|nr:N-acetyltransferase [Microbacteriaceae bacterium]